MEERVKENEDVNKYLLHLKKQKGITLIALIITIIVMLILVAVTIQVVINSGLLKTVGDVVSDYKNVQEQESNLNEVEVNGYNSIEEYLESIYGSSGGNPPIDPPPTTIGSGDKADTTTEYEDSNGDTAVIPGGFTVSGLEDESTIDDGLVIYLIPDGTTVDWENPTEVANAQKTYDQFVWIPISHEQINNMYICQAKTGENGNCNIEVVNGEAKCTVHNSTQMAGRLYATQTGEYFEQAYTEVYTPNTGLREPDVVTDSTYGDGNSENLTQLSSILGAEGYDTTANFKQSLQQEYNEVVKSVYENQGFYIGRYETSGMENSDKNATVKTVAGTTTGISSVTWYRMYAQQKKYVENKGLTSVKSTMIQGAAYDQVMKFVENGTRPDGGTYTIKTAGNVGHDRSSSAGPWQTGGLNYSSSTQYNDKVKNIYDLEGNVLIWTTEAYSTSSRVKRGRYLRQQLFSEYPWRQLSERRQQRPWFLCPALRRSEC